MSTPKAAPLIDALAYGAGVAAVALVSYSTARQVSFMREPYWAAIAAVVVLYPDQEATRQAGLSRFLGTAIGSLIGWGCAAWWHGNLLIYGAAVLVAVSLCSLLRLETAARLCAVAVTVITLVPRDEAPHLVAFRRFAEVSYGVACALVYTALVHWVRALRVRRRSSGAG